MRPAETVTGEQTMRVCIPTISDTGLDGRLSPHSGKAPFFTLAEVEVGRVQAVSNPNERHEEGRCDAVAAVRGRGVDVVVCRGMGLRALEALRRHGLAVLVTDGWTVAAALRELREGTLAPLSRELAGRHAHG